MLRFLGKLVAFAALQGVLAGLLLALAPATTPDYLLATFDKAQRLQSVPPPRLLLLGGSGTAFGFDSPELERLTGRPVVNMGLHVNVGADQMLHEVEAALGPGDVVVLALEYELWLGHPPQREELIVQGLRATAPPGWDWPRFQRWSDGLHLQAGNALRFRLRQWWEPEPEAQPPYTRDSFNGWGDVAAPRTGRPPAETDDAPPLRLDDERQAATLARVRAFHALATERGARVVVWFPRYPEARFAGADGPVVRSALAPLAAEGMPPRLNRPAEALGPWSDFYDTRYHLTAAAARRQSRALAAALRRRAVLEER